jgi:chaperone modulatory protein CbpM
MLPDQSDVFWLDGTQVVSLDELVILSGLSEGEIMALVDLGILPPRTEGSVEGAFSADCVVIARTTKRLQIELELETHALALVIDLLKKIKSLEDELCGLRARQPGSEYS